MNKFLKQVLIFVILPFLGLILLLLCINPKFIPAPMVTNSYCLNEKVFQLSTTDVPYLAVGSSLTLNNFHSEIVTNSLGSNNYINLAAWGMKMKDIFSITRAYFTIYNPKVVFMVSGVDDFCFSQIKFKEQDIVSLFEENDKLWRYAMNFNPPYYYRRYFDNKVNKEQKNIYDSIKFDRYGGVSLTAEDFDIDSARWNRQPPFDQIDERNYHYLDSLCQLVRMHKAKLVFVQSPNRAGLSITKEEQDKMTKHKKRVAAILNKNGHLFIDPTERTWPDSLFLDYGHMHETGSRLFTAFCLEKWQSLKASSSY